MSKSAKFVSLYWVIAASIIFASGNAGAEDTGKGKTGPCHADIEKFCKDVEPGKGAILKCLKDKEAELSEVCRSHHKKMKGMRKEVREACEVDAKKFCGEKKGKERRACVKENREKFSEECRNEWKEMREHMGKGRKNR
jgi:hypothetical protein